jgi:4-amino-4-deoxy-L-arabinose transferase-like glycosyltransferase
MAATMAQGLASPGGETNKAAGWLASRPQLVLVLAVLAALVPFLAKPFNIDDPLFLWVARQIHKHPANPYGFDLNWYGWEAPMWEVTKNPPLASYYLALAAAVLGFGEVALHAAFLLPALAAILGTYRLARRWCPRPMLASCATLLTPAFLVSSTSVMCDTLLLAFWVWAIVLWTDGLERASSRRLAGSAVLIALAALTKYFGICLVPLLLVYSLVQRRRLGVWLVWFLIPIAALGAYHWTGRALYGKGLVSDASTYAVTARADSWASLLSTSLEALAFTGGCLAVATLLACWLWRPRVLACFAVAGLALALAIYNGHAALHQLGAGTSRRLVEIQLLVWAVGGTTVLALALGAIWHWRDASSCLLGLWTGGTFLFAAFLNWTVSARSLLPMAPAVGILLSRRLAENRGTDRPWRRWGVRASFLVAAAISLLVATGDFQLAQAVRESARQSYARLKSTQRTLWFGGHWGFQYYLEELGTNARPAVNGRLKPEQGDLLANPANNTNVEPPRRPQYDATEEWSVEGPRWVTTLNREIGASFYASVLGPLPFSFARVPPERVTVYHLVPTADITLVTSDRADLDCSSHETIRGFHCGFTDQTTPWPGDERSKLQPVYTTDRHLYLVPGLFAEPAILVRFRSEPPGKPRDQLKRFTAQCQLRVVGTLAGVRTRWLADGAWTDPQAVEVATISSCQIDG